MNRILAALQQHAQHQPQQIAFVGHNAQQESVSLSYSQLLEQVEQGRPFAAVESELHRTAR